MARSCGSSPTSYRNAPCRIATVRFYSQCLMFVQIAKCPVAANVAAGFAIGLQGIEPVTEQLPQLPASNALDVNISVEHMLQQG
jgi:hypothetical protein